MCGPGWDIIIGKNEDPPKYRSEDYYSSECFEIALTKQDIAIQDECMLLYSVIVSSIAKGYACVDHRIGAKGNAPIFNHLFKIESGFSFRGISVLRRD